MFVLSCRRLELCSSCLRRVFALYSDCVAFVCTRLCKLFVLSCFVVAVMFLLYGLCIRIAFAFFAVYLYRIAFVLSAARIHFVSFCMGVVLPSSSCSHVFVSYCFILCMYVPYLRLVVVVCVCVCCRTYCIAFIRPVVSSCCLVFALST